MTTVLIISSLSLVFTVLVISIHYQNKARPVPYWARKCFLHGLANVICVRTHVSRQCKKNTKRVHNNISDRLPSSDNKDFHQVEYTAGKSTDEGVTEERGLGEGVDTGDETSDWIELARVLDRFFFYVFLIVVGLSGIFSWYKCVGDPHELSKPLGGYGYKIVEE